MRAYNKEFPFASVTYEGTNGLASARWSRSESDFLGRNISESRPGFGGSTLITSNLYDSASRLVSIISLSTRPNPGASAPSSEINYDLDGNMMRHGEWTYAYNSGNRLVFVVSNGITVVTMSYDTQGRRVRKVAADGTHR